MGSYTKQNFLKRRNSNGQKTHKKMLTISSHKRNANQNHTKIPPHPLEYLSSKTPPPTNVGQDVGKKEPLYTAGGNASWCNCLEKKKWRLLKNLNIDLLYDPAILLLGIYPKECDSEELVQRNLHTHVYCSASHNSQVIETAKMPHY
jgi:hypothetical protein